MTTRNMRGDTQEERRHCRPVGRATEVLPGNLSPDAHHHPMFGQQPAFSPSHLQLVCTPQASFISYSVLPPEAIWTPAHDP